MPGPSPPKFYGLEMERWSAIPTEGENLRVRAAGAKSSGKPFGMGSAYAVLLDDGSSAHLKDDGLRRKGACCKAKL